MFHDQLYPLPTLSLVYLNWHTEVVSCYYHQDGPAHQAASQNHHQLKPYGVLITHENDSLAYYVDTESFESVSHVYIVLLWSRLQSMINLVYFLQIICFNFNPHITNEAATLCPREYLHPKAPHILQIPAHLWLWNRTKTTVCNEVV